MFECIILKNQKEPLFETCSALHARQPTFACWTRLAFSLVRALCDQGHASQSKEILGRCLKDKKAKTIKFKVLSR